MTKHHYKMPDAITWTCDCCGASPIAGHLPGVARATCCPWCERIFCAECNARHSPQGNVCQSMDGRNRSAA